MLQKKGRHSVIMYFETSSFVCLAMLLRLVSGQCFVPACHTTRSFTGPRHACNLSSSTHLLWTSTLSPHSACGMLLRSSMKLGHDSFYSYVPTEDHNESGSVIMGKTLWKQALLIQPEVGTLKMLQWLQKLCIVIVFPDGDSGGTQSATPRSYL